MFYPKIPRWDSPDNEIGSSVRDFDTTEKIDGSFFCIEKKANEVSYYSKRTKLELDKLPNLFKPVVAHIESIKDKIPPNILLFGETLHAKKHNTITYERIPKGHLILFGYKQHADFRVSWEESKLRHYSDLLECEYVKNLPPISRLDDLESMLGGKVEGIVHKTKDGKQCKIVSEHFREVKSKPKATKTDRWEEFKDQFCTEARWQKALLHLSEEGSLKGDMSDIKSLMRETMQDIYTEEHRVIETWLWSHFGKELVKNSIKGLADWYRGKLNEKH